MSRHLSIYAAACLATFVCLTAQAQAVQNSNPTQCVSKLATTSEAFVRASGPGISLVVVSKNIDSAFKYMQAAESLARLLPPGSKSAFVTDESVASVDLQSVAGVSRQVDACEKWATQVYGTFPSRVREEIYASAKNRMEQLRP